MKKSLSSLFILILLLILFWGASGWYFGADAQIQLKKYLHDLNQAPGEKLFRAELLEFDNLPFGGKARLRLYSDVTAINEMLGDIYLDASLLNGPLFISGKGVDLASTRWRLSINQTKLELSQRETLNNLFPDGWPEAMIMVDFDKQAHYRFSLQADAGVTMLNGVYDLDSGANHGEGFISKLNLNPGLFHLNSDEIRFNYQHEKNITPLFQPGVSHLSIPEFVLSHPRLGKIALLDVNGDVAIQTSGKHDEFINLLFDMRIKTIQDKSNRIPVDQATLRISIENLSIPGLISISESKSEMDNLAQQIQWALEESGELPEGQDRIWSLNNQLQQKYKQFPLLVSRRLFPPASEKQSALSATGDQNQQFIQFKLMTQEGKQQSSLQGQMGLDLSGAQNAYKKLNVTEYILGRGSVRLAKNMYRFIKQMGQVDAVSGSTDHVDNSVKNNLKSLVQKMEKPSFEFKLEKGKIIIR